MSIDIKAGRKKGAMEAEGKGREKNIYIDYVY